MVIWITGISASGKTTLSRAIMKKFKTLVPEMCLVDGDEVRALFGNDLSYDEVGRTAQITRIQKFVNILDDQKLCVVVAALYAHPKLLEWNSENFSEYYEIYLNAPLSIVRERDPKGLYKQADAGQMECVVGLDVPWHEPVNPTLKIDVSKSVDVNDLVLDVASVVPKLSRFLTD